MKAQYRTMVLPHFSFFHYQLIWSREIREKIYAQDAIMPIEKQYKLINKLEYVLYSSTKWMVKYLQKNQLDSVHILDHKSELFALLSEVHKQKVEVIIQGDDDFNKGFLPALGVVEVDNL